MAASKASAAIEPRENRLSLALAGRRSLFMTHLLSARQKTRGKIFWQDSRSSTFCPKEKYQNETTVFYRLKENCLSIVFCDGRIFPELRRLMRLKYSKSEH